LFLYTFVAVTLFGLIGVVSPTSSYAAGAERKAKTKVVPAYPDLARRMLITGTVKVEVVVDAAGNVKSATATGGHPLLIRPAEDAAKKWRFEPGTGESTETLEFRFSPSGS
jgi:protein TonB